MRIVTTTLEDFINSEIDEWGHDYVESQFALGYEPMLVNGIWCWQVPVSKSLHKTLSSTSTLNGTRAFSRSSLQTPLNTL